MLNQSQTGSSHSTSDLAMKVAAVTAADAPPSPGGAERSAASADLYGTFSRWHGTLVYLSISGSSIRMVKIMNIDRSVKVVIKISFLAFLISAFPGKALFASDSKPFPGVCMEEGDPTEPLFYCTFGGGKKEISICSELDKNAQSEEDRNSLSYNFGKINKDTDMYLLDKIKNVLHPTVNYSSKNVPSEIENRFVFKNKITSYVLKTESFMHSKGRGFSANLGVIQRERVIANLNCDEGSIIDNSWDGALLEQMAGSFGQNICEGKSKGYGMLNTGLAVVKPSQSRGDDWVKAMMLSPYGYLFLGVDGSEEARFSLEGFEQSMKLTQINSKSLADRLSPLETCFEEWCSVCDEMWPGGDPSEKLCYTIHDVNKSGLMPSFDVYGRAAIQEECYPKLSYPCSFAGQMGNKIAVEMSIAEHNGSGATKFQTGPVQWHLRCDD